MRLTLLDRYYLKEILKVLFFVLFCLFGLYVLIDYTSRASSYQLPFTSLLKYYAYVFIQQLDILVPFSLLISGMKTLIQSNLAQELVAMRAAGHALPQMLRCYIWVALGATACLYLNAQFLSPSANDQIHLLEDRYALQSHAAKDSAVQPLILNDQSRLLYHTYDRAQECLKDCLWIRSFNDVWYLARLFPFGGTPIGHNVKHFVRNESGQLLMQETAETVAMQELSLDPQLLEERLKLPTEQSLSSLWHKLPHKATNVHHELADLQATFYKRTAMPWLCFFALLAPAPFCWAHRRPLRAFMLFAGSLLGLFSAIIFLSVGHTLIRGQIMGPLWTLIIPTLLMSITSLWHFKRSY